MGLFRCFGLACLALAIEIVPCSRRTSAVRRDDNGDGPQAAASPAPPRIFNPETRGGNGDRRKEWADRSRSMRRSPRPDWVPRLSLR